MRRVLLLLFLSSLAFAAAPFPRTDRRTDMEKLQGKWVTVSLIADEIPIDVHNRSFDCVFKGDHFWFLNVGEDSSHWIVTIGKTKNQKTMDLHGVKVADVFGIYRLEGETLTICHTFLKGTMGRPTEFAARQNVNVIVLKRKKS
jgi:uncharacterized protein (TIGR03067 family)